jgi:hypothetical protein
MKQYKAINESSWVEIPNVILTDEEIHTLNKGTEEEKAALREDMKVRSNPIEVPVEELVDVLAIYDEYKPELQEGDVYDLISFYIVLMGEERMGAYNYKLNRNIVNVILS